MTEPLRPYDQAAYEQFCVDLVQAGFSPVPGTARRTWSGPTPSCLTSLTSHPSIEIDFPDGWPYRYAHVTAPGLAFEHAARGVLCLWAEDDPAQIAGITLNGLLDRLAEWCIAASAGFGAADQALDPHIAFRGGAQRWAEIDLPAVLGSATNGHIGRVGGRVENNALLLTDDPATCDLTGAVYFRTGITKPPRTLDELRSLLTDRQRRDLDHGLAARSNTPQNKPSGGHDHIVLSWPRHGTRDALILSFSGTGATLVAHPNAASPSDEVSRLRRAGPDADMLAGKSVLLAGGGAIGGHVALILASSGLGALAVHDGDDLKTVNLVRHVLPAHFVGYPKTTGLDVRIHGTAPWCRVTTGTALPYDPNKLADRIRGHHLVIDCTGISAMTGALAHVAGAETIPLVTGALYHRGALLRVRRQTAESVPLGQRAHDARYVRLPAESSDPTVAGFLELGCTAPVHNAPPAAVLRAAADVAAAAIDELTSRRLIPDDIVTVLAPLPDPPFDRLGTVIPDR